MQANTIFTLLYASIVPFWLLLAFAPRHKITHILIHSGLILVIYTFVYLYYLVTSYLAGGPEGGGMSSLEAVMIALSNPHGVIGAWTHYLVFDLFVGAWITRDAGRLGVSQGIIIIPLLLTFLAGPLGLLLYLVAKAALKRPTTLNEFSAS